VPVGHRVIRSISRPEAEFVEHLGACFSADLADAMKKSGAVSREIKPLYHPMPRIAGPAVTASLPTSAFSMAKIAMDQCQAGDVLVLNAYGDINHALLGGHIGHALKVRGLAGVIVDGAVRDVTDLQQEGLPIFARGTAVIVGGHEGPGEVNVPIACGGVVVNPGDIIVADEDGIVVVPRDEAEHVLEAVRALKQNHDAADVVYGRGMFPGIDKLEAKSRAAGCDFL
jgi:4-hydroxy-4-methyl-2-oxoglutarate aldolase